MPFATDHSPTTGLAAPLLLQEIFSHIEDALIITDAAFVITAWNKGAEKVHGLSAAAVVGRKTSEALTYEYLDCTREEMLRHLNAHNQWRGDVRYERGDGKVLYLQMQVSRLLDEAGNCTGYVGVNRDITELYHKRALLEQYATLLAAFNETYIVVDRDRRIVLSYVTKGMQEFYGFCYREGDDIFAPLPPENRARMAESCNAAFAGNTVSYEVLSPLHPGVTLLVTYFPLPSSNGEIRHICTVVRDVTAQKAYEYDEMQRRAAEEKLFESRRSFQEFMEHSPMPAWIVDGDGRMHYMNPAFMRRHGLSAAQSGELVLSLFPGEQGHSLLRESQAVLGRNEVVATTRRTQHEGGERVERVVRFPIRISDRPMVGGWAVDITEQTNLQQQLLQVEKERSQLVVRSIIETREAERKQLTAALRDNVNQTLVSCRLLLDAVNTTQPELYRVSTCLNDAIRQLNELTDRMDPAILDEIGLPGALQHAASAGGALVPLDVQLADGCLRSIRRDLALGIYRIIQNLCTLARPWPDRSVNLRLMKFGTFYFVLLRSIYPIDLPSLLEGYEWKAIDNQVTYLKGYVQAGTKEIRIHLPE